MHYIPKTSDRCLGSAIDEIMSVRQIHDRINSCIINRESGNKSFTVTLFAFITEMDLDGFARTLMIKW